jgi:hypothetical protein
MKKATLPTTSFGQLEAMEPRLLLSAIVYGDSDLNGTLGLQGVHSAGSLVVDGAGNIATSPVTREDGTAITMTGTYNVATNGVVTASVDASDMTTTELVGAINTTKDLVALNSSTMPDPNTADGNLNILVKHSLGNFSDADMAGIWDFSSEYSHGSVTMNGAGHITGGSVVADGGNETITGGTYSISSSGTVTLNPTTNAAKQPDPMVGTMNDSKDVVAMDDASLGHEADYQAGDDASLALFVKRAGAFYAADGSGTWTLATQNFSGTITFNGKGGFSGTGTDQSGNACTVTGTYTLAANGTMTDHGITTEVAHPAVKFTFNQTGAMNESKNFIAFSDTTPVDGNPSLVVMVASTVNDPPTVTVSVASNSLKITGDALGDQISIAQTGTGVYTITGLNGTEVKLGAVVADSQQVAGATKDITITMGAGDNTVKFVSNLHVGNVNLGTLLGTRGSITYTGGSGIDHVLLGGSTATASVAFTANPANLDTMTLTDALGNTQTFEFDTGALQDQSDIPVNIGATAADTMTNFLAALNEHLLGLLSTEVSSDGKACELVSLPGTAGNQPIVVSSANIAASNFTGGADYLLDAQNVTVNMGDGDNGLSLGTLSTTPASFGSTLLGNLSVTGGKNDDLAVAMDIHVTGNVTANLGAGDNALGVVTTPEAPGAGLSRVGGNFSYTGGAAGDIVDLINGQVGGTLTANMGTAGNDSNEFFGQRATFSGAVTYTGGPTGDNDVDFDLATFDKNVTVTTGAGDDTIDLGGAQVAGTVTVTAGTGTNYFNLSPENATDANVVGAVKFTATSVANEHNSVQVISATLHNTLGVTTGASDDSVNLSGASITGNTTLSLGTGNNDAEDGTGATIAGNFSYTATSVAGSTNTVTLTSGAFGGTFGLTTGASDDTVNLAGSTITGKATLNVGNGTNTVTDVDVTAAPTGLLTAHSDLSVTGGTGDDSLDLSGANVTGKTTLALGTGNNDVEATTAANFTGAFACTATSVAGATNTIDLLSSTFGNTVAITTGASDDTLDLSGAHATGNATINLGAGNNNFQVIGSAAASFGGNLGVTATGSGDNTITVGSAAATSGVTGGLTIATGSGDDVIDFLANVGGNLSVNSGTAPDQDAINGQGGTVTGTATLQAGSISFITLLSMTVMRSATINTGSGMDNVYIGGSQFCNHDGTFALTGGAGADTVNITTTTGDTSPTTFWRAVNINLGAGNDTLNIGASPDTGAGGTGDANSYAIFASATIKPIFNGGTGADSLDYLLDSGIPGLTIPNQFTLPPQILGFETVV